MFKKSFQFLFSNRQKKPTSKKEWRGNFIFLLLITLFFSVTLARNYYWQYQIHYNGQITQAMANSHYTRNKPLEPERYFATFSFYTNTGEKITSKSVEIGLKDNEEIQQNKAINIRYAIKNPIHVAPITPPPTLFIHFMPILFALFTLGATLLAFFYWRKTEE